MATLIVFEESGHYLQRIPGLGFHDALCRATALSRIGCSSAVKFESKAISRHIKSYLN